MLTGTRGRYSAGQVETEKLKEQNHILRNEVDNLRRAFSALRTIQEFIDQADHPDVDVIVLVMLYENCCH